MKKQILKYTAVLVLVFSFVAPAHALAPLIITAAEAAAPYMIAAGISYLMPTNTTNVPKSGYADNYGVKRNLLAKIGPTAAIAITGFMAYQELRGIVNSSPSSYPNLSNRFNLSPSDAVAGSVVKNNLGGSSRYVSQTSGSMTNSTADSFAWGWNPQGTGYYFVTNRTDYLTFYTVKAFVVTSDPPTPVPDSSLPGLLNSSTLGDIYPEVLPEIDKAMRENPEKVLGLNTAGVLKEQITYSARNAATNAQADYDLAKSLYDLNPNDQTLADLKLAEQALLDANAHVAELELNPPVPATSEDFTFTSPPPNSPELTPFNFQPLMDIGDELDDKFPFSLLQTVKAMANSFIATPKTPVFSITFPSPFDYEWIISLEKWDGLAAFIRYLTGATFLAVCAMSIVRRWA